MAADDGLAMLFRGEASGALVVSALFHRIGQADALDRADLGKGPAADDESAGFWTLPDWFPMLCHTPQTSMSPKGFAGLAAIAGAILR